MIPHPEAGIRVQWSDPAALAALPEGKRSGIILEIGEQKQTGEKAVLIKFDDGSKIGMYYVDVRDEMGKV